MEVTKESIVKEFMALAPEYGKWKIDRNLASSWLFEVYDRIYSQAIDDAVGVMSSAVGVVEGKIVEVKPNFLQRVSDGLQALSALQK